MNLRDFARTAGACVLLAYVGVACADESRKPRPIGSHSSGVASVHFSPDGRWLASGGGDKMIRIWDVQSAKEVRAFDGPSSFTCAVRFSPDGKLLAAAGYETSSGNPIFLYDPATGKEVLRLDGHPNGGVRRVEFTPDSKTLVSAGFDGLVRVWDVGTGKQKHALRGDHGTVYGIAVSPDGKLIASAGRDGLKLFDLDSGKEIPREALNKYSCITVTFSPDSKLLAVGDSSSVTIWEVASGKQVHVLNGFKGELAQLLFSADGRTLYSASYDRAIRLWEVRTGRMIHEAEGHSGWVWAIALSPDEKTLASGSVDTKVLAWDLGGLNRPDGRSLELTDKALSRHLADLASSDASAAYRAICALAADPTRSLPRLEARLTAAPTKGPAPKDLALLIDDLDSEEWYLREKATSELEKAGPAALPFLKKAMQSPASLEVKRRVARLLRALDPTQMPAEDLVAVRGVQTLEYMAHADARKLLERLARAPSPRLAEEANQAVERMKRTPNR